VKLHADNVLDLAPGATGNAYMGGNCTCHSWAKTSSTQSGHSCPYPTVRDHNDRRLSRRRWQPLL
jgi:hypothetical protein